MCGILGRVVCSQLVVKIDNLEHSTYKTCDTLYFFHFMKQVSMGYVKKAKIWRKVERMKPYYKICPL